ncbi:MAG: tRNA 2-thiocytidine(32) synthetase TtcA [Clostridia bacterium]|nr:tRNA 2-thiocytidine(32) synthetase TtcA [Clostridia bacterium]
MDSEVAMRRMESLLRRAVADYDMIAEGDRIGVGLSGGKDSLALLTLLAALRRYYPKPFTLTAFTLDLGFKEGGGFDEIAAYCERLDVPFVLKTTEIGPIVFDARQEKNPCALCAKMRRGALNQLAVEHGCNKLALGHHLDDAVETLFLNLFYEGRLGCFSPVTWLSRVGLTVLRPMVYIEEKEIRRLVKAKELPVYHNPCCANGVTKRQEIKELLLRLEKENPGLRLRALGALQRAGLDGWVVPEVGRKS